MWALSSSSDGNKLSDRLSNKLSKAAGESYRKLSLAQKLGLVVGLCYAVLFAVSGLLTLQVLGESKEQVLRERLLVTEMAAAEIDLVMAEAFRHLEVARASASFDPTSADHSAERHALMHAYIGVGAFSLGVYFLDATGRVVLAEGPDPAGERIDISSREEIQRVLQTGHVGVSPPFIDAGTGRTMAAVLVPVNDSDDDRRVVSYLAGIVDLDGSWVRGIIQQATKLGETGHGEIVDERGRVVVSTDHPGYLGPGEHFEFYYRLGRQRRTSVEEVPYESADGSAERPIQHVMAYVPLAAAPWGVALGGDREETFAPVTRLRNTVLLFGSLTLCVTLLVVLVGTRRMVIPIRYLTDSARRISTGDLRSPISIDEKETGEIRVLAETMEEMRAGLEDSLSELTRRGEALAELDRLKSEFISSVSHELRTPLGFIIGYVTTLLRADVPTPEPTRKEFLEIIREEAEKLQELVDNLLDTSRLHAGSLGVEKEPVNVPAIARFVIERARTRTDKHVFAVDFAPDFPVVPADPRRIEQVLYNLVDNAVKYAHAGGQITLIGKPVDGLVTIAVHDEGEGIPTDELSKVFEPFYRVNNAQTRRVHGNGLGLFICRGIVEAHDGYLWAESSPGRGTAVTFTLPNKQEPASSEMS
ncbi:MAG: HAMP domain-containing protein [Chloroflexi bacterium]|nr:HAMP domain-containing protein [Chloroflexota bacterium]